MIFLLAFKLILYLFIFLIILFKKIKSKYYYIFFKIIENL